VDQPIGVSTFFACCRARNRKARVATGSAIADQGVAAEQLLTVRLAAHRGLARVDLDLDGLAGEIDHVSFNGELGDTKGAVERCLDFEFGGSTTGDADGEANERCASSGGSCRSCRQLHRPRWCTWPGHDTDATGGSCHRWRQGANRERSMTTS